MLEVKDDAFESMLRVRCAEAIASAIAEIEELRAELLEAERRRGPDSDIGNNIGTPKLFRYRVAVKDSPLTIQLRLRFTTVYESGRSLECHVVLA